MDELTIKLLSPVKFDGVEYTHLTIKELTVAENLAIQKQHGSKIPYEQDVYFFALSCGVSPDVILALKGRDWNRIKTKYWEVLGNPEPEPESSGS